MLDLYGNVIEIEKHEPSEQVPYTRHELGQVADYLDGLVPMRTAPNPVRVPPALPLATYLVMVRGG